MMLILPGNRGNINIYTCVTNMYISCVKQVSNPWIDDRYYNIINLST